MREELPHRHWPVGSLEFLGVARAAGGGPLSYPCSGKVAETPRERKRESVIVWRCKLFISSSTKPGCQSLKDVVLVQAQGLQQHRQVLNMSPSAQAQDIGISASRSLPDPAPRSMKMHRGTVLRAGWNLSSTVGAGKNLFSDFLNRRHIIAFRSSFCKDKCKHTIWGA